MILENKKGSQKEFTLLFEVKKNEKNYLIYQDKVSGNIYAGEKKKNKLQPIEKEMVEYLNKILEKMN